MDRIGGVRNYVHTEVFEAINLIIHKDSGPLTKLEDILLFHISYLNSNNVVPRIIFSDELHLIGDDIREAIYKNHQHYIETIISIIEEGISCGIFRNDLDVKIAAYAFFGLIQTAYLDASLGFFHSNYNEQFVSIRSFLRGCLINRGCLGKQSEIHQFQGGSE